MFNFDLVGKMVPFHKEIFKLDSMFQEIELPSHFIPSNFSDVIFVAASFHPTVEQGFDSKYDCYPQILREGVSERRLAEFYAGRRCAALSLQRRGFLDTVVSPSETPLMPPTWPIGAVGSISHSRNIAVSASARRSDIQCLGVDVEDVVTEKEAREMTEVVMMPGEFEQNDGFLPTYSQLFTLLFSAKECVYKGIFPVAQIEFSFLDISIQLDSNGRFAFTIEKLPLVALRAGKGIFSLDESVVYTSVAFHEQKGFL